MIWPSPACRPTYLILLKLVLISFLGFSAVTDCDPLNFHLEPDRQRLWTPTTLHFLGWRRYEESPWSWVWNFHGDEDRDFQWFGTSFELNALERTWTCMSTIKRWMRVWNFHGDDDRNLQWFGTSFELKLILVSALERHGHVWVQ